MITAKKNFGQNFLKDLNIISKIINSIEANDADLIIEIGPGQGALTKYLKEKKCNLLCFEIDERMHVVLDGLEDDKTKVIYEDILSVDLNSILSSYNYNKLYVIANLPYYITTPIIEKLMFLDVKIDKMTLMVQKEVADRFASLPGKREYGMMSVLINSKYNVKKLFDVKNTCFVPAPKVDSAVVHFTLKEEINNINDFDKFKNLISKSFMHKRKTLKNNLGNELFSKLLPILYKYNFDSSVRAEEIPADVYIEMSNIL